VRDWLSANLVRSRVTVRGEVRTLTPTECALLSVLLAHWGKGVSADTLLERVWRGSEIPADNNALRVHLHRLRSKVEDDPDNPQIVLTDRGEGYRLSRA
jgi:DNA-binding response OmpR family regulator